jgi:hypothetical protein
MPDTLEPGFDAEVGTQLTLIPHAFSEAAHVRIAYLQAVTSNVYGHLTVQQATDQLNSTLDALLVAGVLLDYPRPVRSLSGAKVRLGINPDFFITQYVLCPICWKHLTPHQVDELESPQCQVQDCSGILFQETYNKKNRHIRMPFLVNPQTSIVGALEWIFMRPGWVKTLKDNWPTPRNHANHNDDENSLMSDMDDATEWYQPQMNTVHEVSDNGTV